MWFVVTHSINLLPTKIFRLTTATGFSLASRWMHFSRDYWLFQKMLAALLLLPLQLIVLCKCSISSFFVSRSQVASRPIRPKVSPEKRPESITRNLAVHTDGESKSLIILFRSVSNAWQFSLTQNTCSSSHPGSSWCSNHCKHVETIEMSDSLGQAGDKQKPGCTKAIRSNSGIFSHGFYRFYSTIDTVGA